MSSILLDLQLLLEFLSVATVIGNPGFICRPVIWGEVNWSSTHNMTSSMGHLVLVFNFSCNVISGPE